MASQLPRDDSMAIDPGGRSLLIDDAAVLLGVSRRTIYYRIRAGQLETMRTRCGSQRVLLSSIERMLRRERGLPPLDGRVGETSQAEALSFQIEPLSGDPQ